MPEWTNGTVNLRKIDISDSTFQEMEAKKLTLTEVNLAGSKINCANLEMRFVQCDNYGLRHNRANDKRDQD
jgi:hypothetical protein